MSSNVTFGVRRNQNPDPNIKRPYQRVWDIGIQHEIVRGLAVSVSYNQRSFYNIIWTQNLSIPYSQYTVVTIADPQGNGGTIPVYNVNRSVFGQVNELDTNSSINTRVYKGVDVSVGWRLPGGGTLTGGTSTGRTLTNTCDVEDPNNQRFCDYNQYSVPLQTLFKLSGTYPLPYGVRVSGTFQHTPGSERIVTYQVSSTQVPTLVRSVNERLNEPGRCSTTQSDRLDHFTKSFRRGRYDCGPGSACQPVQLERRSPRPTHSAGRSATPFPFSRQRAGAPGVGGSGSSTVPGSRGAFVGCSAGRKLPS